MKFNYDLYRPKKIIQDAWKSNSTYFRSKDVNVTPLTKIGDADEVYKSQSAGRIPALAKKLKPNRLALDVTLARGKKIFVRSAAPQKRVKVSAGTPSGTSTKRPDASPTKGQAAWRFNVGTGVFRKEPAVTRRNLLARGNPVLNYLVVAVVAIGIAAGSVHAYTSRSNTAHPEVLGHSSSQSNAQQETSKTEKDTDVTSPATPNTPATSPPATQAASQSSTPTTNTASDNQPSASSNPPETANSGAKDIAASTPTPQATSTAAPPATTTPPPSTPVNTLDPPTTPTSPPPPTTPPSNEANTPQVPDESQQETDTNTSTDKPIIPTTPPTPSNSATPAKGHASSTQGSTKQ